MLRGISLIVSDMANTVINERGIIYRSIGKTLNQLGIETTNLDKQSWHGRDKREVLSTYVDDAHLLRCAETMLMETLNDQYFDGSVDLFDGVPEWIRAQQSEGILVTLNTGYPSRMQRKLIRHFNLDVDNYISSSETQRGRPSPFMIFELMRRTGIDDVRRVAKIGDTPNDMLEGKHAGCLTIGVLTGESSKDQLYAAGADFVVPTITDVSRIPK